MCILGRNLYARNAHIPTQTPHWSPGVTIHGLALVGLFAAEARAFTEVVETVIEFVGELIDVFGIERGHDGALELGQDFSGNLVGVAFCVDEYDNGCVVYWDVCEQRVK